MRTATRHRTLLPVILVGAALAHLLPALWAAYMLINVGAIAGAWLFTPIGVYMLFRIVAAFLAILGLGTVAVTLKRGSFSKAKVPATLVCIVGALILLEIAALWVQQTEALVDGLPEIATSAVVILAAVGCGRQWPHARYMARATVLIVVGLYVFRYGRSFVGAIDLPWQSLVAYVTRLSELLSLTLPLVLLDLLCGAQEENNDTVPPGHAGT